MADIFIQHTDGTVEILPASQPVAGSEQVVLGRAPRLPLVTEDDKAKTRFIVSPSSPIAASPFLVTEKAQKSAMTSNVQAINYDDRYYSKDIDEPTEEVYPYGEPWIPPTTGSGKIMVVSQKMKVFLSTDGGQTWVQKTPIGHNVATHKQYGRSTLGGSLFSNYWPSYARHQVHFRNLMVGGSVTEVQFYSSSTKLTAKIRATLYGGGSSLNSSSPLIIAGPEITGVQAGWNTLPLGTAVNLEYGQWYAAGFMSDTDIDSEFSTESWSQASSYSTDSYADGPSATMGTTISDSPRCDPIFIEVTGFPLYEMVWGWPRQPGTAICLGGSSWGVITNSDVGDGNILWVSADDGETWEPKLQTEFGQYLTNIASDPLTGRVMLVEDGGAASFFSGDYGQTWISNPISPTFMSFFDADISLAYFNGRWWVYGANYGATGCIAIWSADNGQSWADGEGYNAPGYPVFLTNEYYIRGLAGDGVDTIVSCTTHGQIWSRTGPGENDLINRYLNTDVEFMHVAWTGTRFICVGRSALSANIDVPRVFASIDGITWTEISAPATADDYTPEGVLPNGEIAYFGLLDVSTWYEAKKVITGPDSVSGAWTESVLPLDADDFGVHCMTDYIAPARNSV